MDIHAYRILHVTSILKNTCFQKCITIISESLISVFTGIIGIQKCDTVPINSPEDKSGDPQDLLFIQVKFSLSKTLIMTNKYSLKINFSLFLVVWDK